MDAPLPPGLVSAWEQFFADESCRPCGFPSYTAVFTDPVIFPLQRRREMEEMMRVASAYRPKTVMEIGADKAGGLYHWIKCHPSVQRVVACEIRGTPYSSAFERAFPGVSFLWLPCSSYAPETVEMVKTWLGNDHLDCLFIDGDKTAFLKDYDLYTPLVRRPGVVFLHDYRDDGPRQAHDELLNRGVQIGHILDITESLDAVNRQRMKITSASTHEDWLRHWHGRSCGVAVVHLES